MVALRATPMAKGLRERLTEADRHLLRRISSARCSCVGEIWDGFEDPPQVCEVHGV